MHYLNYILTTLFLPITYPIAYMPKWLGIILVSLLTSVIALLVYKRVSNPDAIREAKDKIKAGLLEVILFKDSPRQIFKSQIYILRANIRYFTSNLKPIFYLIIPFVMLIIQIEPHLGYRPFNKGEVFVFRYMNDKPVSLKFSGLKQETEAMNIDNSYLIRLKQEANDKGVIRIEDDIRLYVNSKDGLFVGSDKSLLSLIRPLKWGSLNHIDGYNIPYQSADIDFIGLKTYWLYPYFILTIVFGFGLKGFLKVEL